MALKCLSDFHWIASSFNVWLKTASPHHWHSFFFFLIIIYLFIFWLCWVFVAVRGLSLVTTSGGHSSSRCAGLSLSRPLLWRRTGSRRTGSVVVAHGPSCSAECGILPDQGSNPCPLHWQADSQPLRHQGSPHWHSLLEYLQGYLCPFSVWKPPNPGVHVHQGHRVDMKCRFTAMAQHPREMLI